MADLLTLDGFSPLPQGPTLSMTLSGGQSLCLLGPAGGGKTRFLRSALGLERQGQGRATLGGPVVQAGTSDWPRRATPLAIVKRICPSKRATIAGEALYAAGLWERQNVPIDDLSRGQRAAAELLPCLAAEGSLLVVDGHFDRLDVWSLRRIMDALRKRLSLGCAMIAITNRADLAVHFDHLAVLKDSAVRFVGSLEQLLREHGQCEVEVETINQPGVRALVAPFEVSIRETPGGLVLRAAEGQQIAAKLLAEGYGDVKMMVLREASIESALDDLLT